MKLLLATALVVVLSLGLALVLLQHEHEFAAMEDKVTCLEEKVERLEAIAVLDSSFIWADNTARDRLLRPRLLYVVEHYSSDFTGHLREEEREYSLSEGLPKTIRLWAERQHKDMERSPGFYGKPLESDGCG